MECTRGSALALTTAQFVALVCVMGLYTDKRPLFGYQTSVSYADIVRALNHSGDPTPIPMLLKSSDALRTEHTVNPFIPSSSKNHDRYDTADQLNSSASHIALSEISAFGLFLAAAVSGMGYSLVTMQVFMAEDVQCDSAYGEHGVTSSLGWETLLWVYIWIEHIVVAFVMSSPVDTVYVTMNSFAVTVFLILFCYASCCSHGEKDGVGGAARRFELPVLISLCLFYVFFVSNSKIVVSRHFTYMIWVTYLAFDGLLILGHAWDREVAFSTIVNCRWTYVILTGWMNVILYVAF